MMLTDVVRGLALGLCWERLVEQIDQVVSCCLGASPRGSVNGLDVVGLFNQSELK